MTAESEFLKITADRYHALQQRLERAHDPRPLPFPLTIFRERLKHLLDGVEGFTRCHYCSTPVNIFTLQVDHMTPISQGGALGFENLCIACEPCNQTKGNLTAEGFVLLREFMREKLPPVDGENLRRRLQSDIRLAYGNRNAKKKAAQGASL
jgi:hypothetical protein